MKKAWSILMIALTSFVLVACGPSEEAQPFITAGDAAMVDEDYDKAIKSYGNAYNIDEHDKIFAKLKEARGKKYEVLNREYSKKKSELYHAEALKILDEMTTDFKEFIPTDEVEENDKDRKELKKLVESQKRYDKYVTDVKPYYMELRAISNEWNTVAFTLNLGNYSKAKMDQDIGNLSIRNMKVATELDNMQLNVEPTLAPIHTDLINTTINISQGLSASLGALRENKPSSEVVSAGESATFSQTDIANFTSLLANYASDNNLRDTFRETLVEEALPTEEAAKKEAEKPAEK